MQKKKAPGEQTALQERWEGFREKLKWDKKERKKKENASGTEEEQYDIERKKKRDISSVRQLVFTPGWKDGPRLLSWSNDLLRARCLIFKDVWGKKVSSQTSYNILTLLICHLQVVLFRVSSLHCLNLYPGYSFWSIFYTVSVRVRNRWKNITNLTLWSHKIWHLCS